MNVLKLFSAASFVLAAAFLSGCSGDCNRASDCAAGQVCYAGLCEPGSEEALSKLCSSDVECNGDPNASGFVCRAGRCIPDPTIAPSSDAGLGVRDMGMQDTGVMDAGTSTTTDAGMIPTDMG